MTEIRRRPHTHPTASLFMGLTTDCVCVFYAYRNRTGRCQGGSEPAQARLLTVVYTVRAEDRIRFISARKATASEAKFYA